MKIDECVPALVRQVDDLAELASRINAAHEAGEESTRHGLEHYRAAGEMLLRAKERCGHGKWLEWLKTNVKFSERRAQQYMKLANPKNSSDLSWENWQEISLSPKYRDESPPGGVLEEDKANWQQFSHPERLKTAPGAVLDELLDQEWLRGEDNLPCPEFNDTYLDEVPPPSEHRPHVSHNSGENEWYTPPEYLEAARAVLGTIDLDPASCHKAQENVRAKAYFTKDTDGLAQHWSGKVWLNPPYQAGLINQLLDKLARHFEAGDVSEAIVLVNNATETAWFQSLAGHASALCFPQKRIKFLDASGQPANKTPLQGQTFLYLGMNRIEFLKVFSRFGLLVEATEANARTASDSFPRTLKT